MKWPRGKYNGERIAGVSIRSQVNVFVWRCWFDWRFGLLTFGVGPWHVWITLTYEETAPRLGDHK